MTRYSFIYLLSQKWRIVFWFAVLAMAVSALFSVIITPKYRASAQILITQKYGQNTDVYAAAKFTEYLSNLLEEVVYSKSFFDQVMNAGFGAKNDFSGVPEKRARQWRRVVYTKVISNTGIISINVYHADREQADRLAKAIASILVTRSDQYHGAGSQVAVRIIDGVSTTRATAVPNIPLNMALSLAAGIILGSMFIYLFPELEMARLLGEVNFVGRVGRMARRRAAAGFSMRPARPVQFGQEVSREHAEAEYNAVMDAKANN